jgi:hypothetical protein
LCAIIREFRGCDTDEVSEQEDGENKGQVSFTLPEGLNPAMAGIFLDEANDLLELIEEQMAAWAK